VTQQQAPAGWYDDPTGGGGRRYWNGSVWTDRVEGGRASTTQRATGSRDRIPDGYMLLNGQQVPLGGTLPHRPRSGVNGFVIAGLIAAAVVAVLIVLGAGLDVSSSQETPVEVETFEVEDLDGSPW